MTMLNCDDAHLWTIDNIVRRRMSIPSLIWFVSFILTGTTMLLRRNSLIDMCRLSMDAIRWQWRFLNKEEDWNWGTEQKVSEIFISRMNWRPDRKDGVQKRMNAHVVIWNRIYSMSKWSMWMYSLRFERREADADRSCSASCRRGNVEPTWTTRGELQWWRTTMRNGWAFEKPSNVYCVWWSLHNDDLLTTD